MATPFELVGVLDQFSFIFPFILTFALVFGALSYKEMFNTAVNAIVAIAVAFIALITPGIMDIISFIAPWFAILLVVVLIGLMMLKFLGVDDHAIEAVVNQQAGWYVFIVMLILLFGAVGKVYLGEGNFEEEELTLDGEYIERGEGEKRFWKTIFNINVMGFILVMLIAVFTIVTLTGGGPSGGGGHGGGHGHH